MQYTLLPMHSELLPGELANFADRTAQFISVLHHRLETCALTR